MHRWIVCTRFSHPQGCSYEIFYTSLSTFNFPSTSHLFLPQGGFYVWVTLPEDTSAQGMYPCSGVAYNGDVQSLNHELGTKSPELGDPITLCMLSSFRHFHANKILCTKEGYHIYLAGKVLHFFDDSWINYHTSIHNFYCFG